MERDVDLEILDNIISDAGLDEIEAKIRNVLYVLGTLKSKSGSHHKL